VIDATDRRGLGLLGWLVAWMGCAHLVSAALGLRWVQEVEWPTDLLAIGEIARAARVDVAIVGSSRSHYGLAPTAIDACLGEALGRPTRTLAANRLAASSYAADLVARGLFSGERAPRVLVVEVAPESLNEHHFELDYNVGATAELQDVPECVAAAVGGPLRAAACLRPFTRGVENLAFFLHRPFTEHAHITWMARYAGGGQYCFGAPGCQARNAEYDARHAGRWQTRVERVLPKVRRERFVDYHIEGGLPAAHLEALLARAKAEGVRVLLLNLPVSAAYQAEVPPAAYATFLAWTAPVAARHGATFVDLNVPEWQARHLYVDPDHLGAGGSERMSDAVCARLSGWLE